MLGLLIPIALAGTVIMVSRKSRAANGAVDGDRRTDSDFDAPSIPTSMDTRDLVAAAGGSAIWQDMFALISYGESKHRDDVARGIVAGTPPWVHVNVSKPDAAAAASAYNRNAKWLQPCWPRVNYVAASYGRYQMFPASGLAAFKASDIYKCLHPWSLFDPIPSTIMAVWMARRLQAWDNWDGTVAGMRAGWADPSSMHNPTAAKLEKWGGHCQEIGLPPSFLKQQLPRWKPAPAVELYHSMGGDPLWLPEAFQEVA